jgi:hypothetical protein
MLPAEGELVPNATESIRLTGLRPLLVYHGRLDVVLVRVIDVPQAAIALYARSVLLLSRVALKLLTPSELQAVVAHELGHEYFWDDYQRARAAGDVFALQEVELKCDGVAALSLAAVGLNTAALDSGVRRMTQFNRAIGATANAAAYPDVEQRSRFQRAILALAVVRGAAVPTANGSLLVPDSAIIAIR